MRVSERSWIATAEQIRASGFNLTANRCKPVITEAVNHGAPTDILRDVLGLENEIARRSSALLAQIRGKK